jgi:hypothetical protein
MSVNTFTKALGVSAIGFSGNLEAGRVLSSLPVEVLP